MVKNEPPRLLITGRSVRLPLPIVLLMVAAISSVGAQLKKDPTTKVKTVLSPSVSVPCALLGTATFQVGKLDVRAGVRSVEFVKLEGYESFVGASGRWRLVSGSSDSGLPIVNAVQIMCDPRKCEERLALLTTKLDAGFSGENPGLLWTDSNEYRVVRYAPNSITAVREAPAADITLTISPEHGTAERVVQETEARGAKGANPKPWRWVLE